MNARLNVALGFRIGWGDRRGALCTGYPLVKIKASELPHFEQSQPVRAKKRKEKNLQSSLTIRFQIRKK
jgi:hypothetical protein